MELRTEDDIGPYKRHKLLTGKIYYPALGYSGYGDGKSTHITDFVTHQMRLDMARQPRQAAIVLEVRRADLEVLSRL